VVFSKFMLFIFNLFSISIRRFHIYWFRKFRLFSPHRSIFIHFFDLIFSNISFSTHVFIFFRLLSIRTLVNPEFEPSNKFSMLIKKYCLLESNNIFGTSFIINSSIFSFSKINSFILRFSSISCI
jgi:hypothetical protein